VRHLDDQLAEADERHRRGQLGRPAAPAHVAAGGFERGGGAVAVVREDDDVVDRERPVGLRRGRRRRALGGEQRQAVGPLPREPLDAQLDDAAPRRGARQPHAQPAERERAVGAGSEAERGPGGGLVGDHQLPGGGHGPRSLPPFPDLSWSR
jgi:hypothetical protein